MTEHEPQPCPKPRPHKRDANRLWICPGCGRAWVLRHTMSVPPRHWTRDPHAPGCYDSPAWGWFPWVPVA